MIFNRWHGERFTRIKAILKKAKDILRKTVFIAILVGMIFEVGGGLLYEKYCQDKIIAREQYLRDISKTMIPPPNAIRVEDSMLQKFFCRSYIVYYQNGTSADEVFRYYTNELMKQGYAIEKIRISEIRTSKLRGQKGDIIIDITWYPGKNKFSVHIIFDDIYEKMHF